MFETTNHNELGRSTIFHGKTHYFDWAIFNSLGTAAMNSYGYLWLSISLALLAQRPYKTSGRLTIIQQAESSLDHTAI